MQRKRRTGRNCKIRIQGFCHDGMWGGVHRNDSSISNGDLPRYGWALLAKASQIREHLTIRK